MKSGYGIVMCFLLTACSSTNEYNFKLLKSRQTGIHFNNILEQSTEWNVFNYMYFYNGGGLAAGDFNNDGFIDLYFTANQGPNKMYLNQGNFKFKEVPKSAGVEGSSNWSTGASVVDINQDGLLDIYVSQVCGYQHFKGHNELFVCQKIQNGIPLYKEQSTDYGLDLQGFGTQAVFFDYDKDGDLDMFQLNHSLHQNGTFGARRAFHDKSHPLAGDKLMRNDAGNFLDVTAQSGIINSVLGYGLGVKISDVNEDGWPDIYVGNDFHENDYLYINQGDGSFTEDLTNQITHTSRFTMGVDIADINNDGLQDILTLDMLPEDPYILKSSLGEDGYNIYQYKIDQGYHHQFARNHLQLNRGNDRFSDIAMFAGVEATDWSWAPLIFDFDNDGFKDIFISNGIPRRMNDIDYINFRSNDPQDTSAQDIDLSWTDRMPQIKLRNKLYRNSKTLRFRDIDENIKSNSTSYSNGAVVADLNNDGQLDIVVNNIDDEPFIYKNITNNHNGAYIAIKLQGPEGNINGVGSQLIVEGINGEVKTGYYNSVSGFQSSCADLFHLGVGERHQIKTILFSWPDGRIQKIHIDSLNRRFTLNWRDSEIRETVRPEIKRSSTYEDYTTAVGLASVVHKENDFVHFNRETLIPFMTSADGPALAVGDINSDGLEDIYLGSSKRERSQLFLQQLDGSFRNIISNAMIADSIYEEVDACFADVDNDLDLDLIIATGGSEYRNSSMASRQRLYLNDGNGNFAGSGEFDSIHLTASCVRISDYDLDGDLDIFFGGRSVSWAYGVVPHSYLLENDGHGHFKDVSHKLSNIGGKLGMITDANWSLMNDDSLPDLVLSAEWEPITVLLNKEDTFQSIRLSEDKGWWRCLEILDVDADGDLDVFAGNLGENSRLKPSLQEPIELYVNDFDDNGQVEQILSYYVKSRKIPFASYAEIMKQLPELRKKYLYAQDFAKADFTEIFDPVKLDSAIHWQATTFSHLYFENLGDGLSFKTKILPDEFQLAPINDFELSDIGPQTSLLIAGNEYHVNIEMGRYDGAQGAFICFTEGQMNFVPLKEKILGDVQHILPIRTIFGECMIIAKNDAAVQLICKEGPTI